MRVLVVGSGMYVCGRHTDGYGTILPALVELLKQGLIDEVFVYARSEIGLEIAREKIKSLCVATGIDSQKVKTCSGDLDECIEKIKPQAAVVSIPNHAHFEMTKKLIKKKIHVLVVKPLVTSVEENLELVALAKTYGIIGAVEYHKRFDEANLVLKDLIDEGRLGKINQINIDYTQRRVIPEKVFTSWIDRTDIFEYLGVHYVDLISFMTAADPKSVLALGMKSYLVSKGIDAYDQMVVLIQWEKRDGNRFLSNHTTGWIDPESSTAMSNQSMKVYGTEGQYESDQKNRGISFVGHKGLEHINPYFSRHYREGEFLRYDGYALKSIRSFIETIRKDSMPAGVADFQSSLPVTKVIEGVKTSLKNNSWISL